ncbi:MAG: hypothetical protein ABR596_01570 [Halarsenatibacteraceae bacterium]
MPEHIKKFGILIIIITLLPVLSSCDSLQEDTELEYSYLSISADNEYGVQKVVPDLGRYRYEEGTIVDIEFDKVEGYDFLGWQGKDGEEVVAENGNYIIQMNDNKKIIAALELKEFKPLAIDFSGIEPIAYENAEEITGVLHNLEEVKISFNNALYSDNELEIRIENTNNGDSNNIDSNNIEINENSIIISLLDWRDGFFIDEEEEGNLKFAEEYQLIVETPYDHDNREYEDEELVVNFEVEEPYPEVPENVRFDDDKAELSWRRSKENAKIDLNKEEYVNKYIVYKFVGESNFEKENAAEEIEVDVNNPADEKVIRQKVEFQEDNIYYRVIAINNYENKSGLSEVVNIN